MPQQLPTSGRSAVWVENNVIGIRDVPVAAPDPGDVLVRIRAAGICGSDLHGFHGEGRRMHIPGIGPGHELAGEVVALGPGVGGPPVGTRVAVLAGRVCGTCEFCRGGRTTLCPQLRISGAGYAGGMGEYFMAQSPYLYPIPDGMPWPVAALSEPCGISLHALKRGGIVCGQRVLVLGAGTIGLFATLIAHDAGASRLGITARYPQQAESARRLGATDVFDPNDVGPGSAAAKGTWDLVVETVGGTAPTLQQAINLVNRGGTVVLLGVHTEPQTIQTGRIFYHDLTIVGSFGYHNTGPRSDYEETIELLAKYQDRVAPLVTHTYPLEQASEAFKTALDKRSGAIKVTVLP
jgi:2-desacetyl-2-hydroxyethyl bacteriochlorophyllide A dehydrogenase